MSRNEYFMSTDLSGHYEHLRFMEIGIVYSFAAAELVFIGSCTSVAARSKTSFSLLWRFWRNGCGIPANELATQLFAWRVSHACVSSSLCSLGVCR